MDADQVDLAEYERLRGEIDNRTQIADGLVAVELTALGVGLAAFESFPDVVIGVATLSTFLWMLLSDQGSQVVKIAAYLHIELGARIRAAHPGAMGWEAFLRRLDRGDDEARVALRLPASANPPACPRTDRVGTYVSLLFGGAPVLLLLVSVATLFGNMPGWARVVRAVTVAGAGVAWWAGWQVYRRFRELAAAVDAAIASSSRP